MVLIMIIGVGNHIHISIDNFLNFSAWDFEDRVFFVEVIDDGVVEIVFLAILLEGVFLEDRFPELWNILFDDLELQP